MREGLTSRKSHVWPTRSPHITVSRFVPAPSPLLWRSSPKLGSTTWSSFAPSASQFFLPDGVDPRVAHPKPTHYRLPFCTGSFASPVEVFAQVGEHYVELVCSLSIPILLPDGVDTVWPPLGRGVGGRLESKPTTEGSLLHQGGFLETMPSKPPRQSFPRIFSLDLRSLQSSRCLLQK
ncbi:hypothetical protein PoB_000101200 [Plakobranchus ocellatus]|uniref:Uncharacterized protein n=1 Tax=Plakobranchus ocellatus TaxID=259542 RepID=A0AAV3XVM4_9GAST|nr:hypothetical protein PoB_000101200 [Plakobranchus ocellatus]